MNILILGAGMMGRAIAFDLLKNSPETQIQLADTNKQTLQSAQQFLNNTSLQTIPLDINMIQQVKKQFITSETSNTDSYTFS